MSRFRFLKYPVYKDIQMLTKDFLPVFIKLNSTGNRNIKWQLERALLSVRLNLVEGTSRKSKKEFGHYLQISIGSLFEVVACVDYANEIINIDSNIYKSIIVKSENIGMQLTGILRSLN